jgi:hypothetical protein
MALPSSDSSVSQSGPSPRPVKPFRRFLNICGTGLIIGCVIIGGAMILSIAGVIGAYIGSMAGGRSGGTIGGVVGAILAILLTIGAIALGRGDD